MNDNLTGFRFPHLRNKGLSVASTLDFSRSRGVRIWVVRILGLLLLAVAVFFLAREIAGQTAQLTDYFGKVSNVIRIGVCALAYSAGLLLVCAAWLGLLRGWAGRAPSFVEAQRIFAVSNLLKYLPTNVMHLVGRYAWLRQRGYGHGEIIWSLLAETVLMVLTACMLSAGLVLPFLLHYLAIASWRIEVIAGAAAAGAAFLALLVAVKKATMLRGMLSRLNTLCIPTATAVLYYLVFLLLNSVLLAVLLGNPVSIFQAHAFAFVGTVTTAWIAGLVVPAAPGGLGVREAVLIAGLHWIGFGNDSVLGVLAYRISTLSGDGIAALGSVLAEKALKRLQIS